MILGELLSLSGLPFSHLQDRGTPQPQAGNEPLCQNKSVLSAKKCPVCDQKQCLGQATAMPPTRWASRQALPLPWASVSPQASASCYSSENSPTRSPPCGGALWSEDWLRAGRGTPTGWAVVQAPRADWRFLDAPKGTGPSCPCSVHSAALGSSAKGGHWGWNFKVPSTQRPSQCPAHHPSSTVCWGPSSGDQGQGQPILQMGTRGLPEVETSVRGTTQG